MENAKISIVLPDGSMEEPIKALFARAGLPIVVGKKRTKEGRIDVPWIERVVFQRPQEIPAYINRRHFDVGIVGEDWVANWGLHLPTLLTLPIGRGGNKPVRIVLAVNAESGITDIHQLHFGAEIATEYVLLVEKFVAGQGREDLRVTHSVGNTEHKIRFGADAIVDVTETGDSLRENGLTIIAEIMTSNTILVANEESFGDTAKHTLMDCLARLLWGAHEASKYVMITANVPSEVYHEAGEIMGGLKGPTVSPLLTEGWSAFQSVVLKERESKIIMGLLDIGVTGIVVNRHIDMVMG